MPVFLIMYRNIAMKFIFYSILSIAGFATTVLLNKLKQNNDLSYTIRRNKGRDSIYLGCDYLSKVHRLLIIAGSDKNNKEPLNGQQKIFV